MRLRLSLSGVRSILPFILALVVALLIATLDAPARSQAGSSTDAISNPSATRSQPSATKTTLTDDPAYKSKCAKCHGSKAEGKHLFGGPSLKSGRVAAMSEADLTQLIDRGKGRMPGFAKKLSRDQIQTLVAHIETLQSDNSKQP